VARRGWSFTIEDYSGPTHEPAVFFFNKKNSPRHKWKRIPRK